MVAGCKGYAIGGDVHTSGDNMGAMDTLTLANTNSVQGADVLGVLGIHRGKRARERKRLNWLLTYSDYSLHLANERQQVTLKGTT